MARNAHSWSSLTVRGPAGTEGSVCLATGRAPDRRNRLWEHPRLWLRFRLRWWLRSVEAVSVSVD
eukprot:14750962-Alexandrium_andersonii.AAC.1